MSSQDKTRVAWLDVAKSACILLVILFHARHQTFLLDWSFGPATPLWESVNAFLKPLRMPVFFLVSGVVTASSLKRQWEEVRFARVYRNLFVYVVWAIVFLAVIPDFPSAERLDVPFYRMMIATLSGESLAWYLWALAVAFALAWATRQLPWWIPVIVTGFVAVLVSVLEPAISAQMTSFLRCLPFFAFGIRRTGTVTALAQSGDWRWLTVATGLFATLQVATMQIGLKYSLIADIAGCLASIIFFSMLTAYFGWVQRAGTWLGQRTMPIYVLHFPILVAIPIVVAPLIPPALLASPWLALSFPLLASGASVYLSVQAHKLFERSGLGWMFGRRNPGKMRVERAYS